MDRITIGFVPRERFSLAARSLACLFERTPEPFRLLVIDGAIPPVYRHEIDGVLAGRPQVDVIRTDHYLTPNQAKNLAIEQADGEFLVLLENDVLVEPGWLQPLVTACRELPADVATPLLVEGRGRGKVHFDTRLGSIRRSANGSAPGYEFVRRHLPPEAYRSMERGLTQTVEVHCLLFRRDVFDRIGPLDEALSTREPVDLSLTLFAHGVPVVYEPRSVVRFVPPPPVESAERAFFRWVWDIELAKHTHDYLRRKWQSDLPSSMRFVRDRRNHESHLRYRLSRPVVLGAGAARRVGTRLRTVLRQPGRVVGGAPKP